MTNVLFIVIRVAEVLFTFCFRTLPTTCLLTEMMAKAAATTIADAFFTPGLSFIMNADTSSVM